jgi:hypothetical protein
MSASHLRAREPFCIVSSGRRSFHSAVEAGFFASCLAVYHVVARCTVIASK